MRRRRIERPLTRQDLDARAAQGCDFPGCGSGEEFWFHARCHLDRPTWVRYEDGVLIVTCSACRKEVARILVAPEPIEEGI